jgi:AmiR/NasT family two-component response regulator
MMAAHTAAFGQACIPNFRGMRALVLHPRDLNASAIADQLGRLGVLVSVRWPAERVTAHAAEIVFFDVDLGFEGLFAWPTGEAPVPLIAVLGSEALGRIEWMLAQGPSAYLTKPIGSTGVFSALAIAAHNFSRRHATEETLRQLESQRQMRGVLLRATLELMRRHGVEETTALSMLRAESMRRRMALEAVSAWIINGGRLQADAGPSERMQGKRHRGGTG